MDVQQELQRLRGRSKVAAIPAGAARNLLTAPTSAAVALLVACKDLLGEYFEWEPESIWLELGQRGIDVPEENRDKIMAGLALLFIPSFYWDAVVFEKTALAFAHITINPDRLEEASSAQLAWAVKEAAWVISLHGDPVRDFDHEPGAYAAVVLHREGFVEAPENLAFSQKSLDLLNDGPKDLRDQVQKAWKALDKETLNEHLFAETSLDVQLARLATVEVHVQEQEKRTAQDLAMLA